MNLIHEYIREELHNPPAHIFERSYVVGVLGIPLPLNESYPYSAALEEQIIYEHLLFEGFFSNVVDMAGDAKTIMTSLKKISGDPELAAEYISALKSGLIDDKLEKITKFLKEMAEQFGDWGMKVFDALISAGNKILEMLEAMYQKAGEGTGWKGVIGITGFGLLIAYIWKNFGKWIKSGLEKLKEMAGVVDQTKKDVNESFYIGDFLDEAERLDEFLGFGKKKKKKDSQNIKHGKTSAKVKKAEKTAEKVEKGAEKVEKGAEKVASAEEKVTEILADDEVPSGIDASKISEENAGKLRTLIDWFKENILGALKNIGSKFLKSFGQELVMGAASGGASVFLSAAKKAFKGLGFVTSTLGPALEKFSGREKNKDDKKDKTPAEKETKAESLIREYIRKLLVENVEEPDMTQYVDDLEDLIFTFLFTKSIFDELQTLEPGIELPTVLPTDIFDDFENVNEVHIGVLVTDDNTGGIDAAYVCVPENRSTSNLVLTLEIPRDYPARDDFQGWLSEELADALSHEIQHSCDPTDMLMSEDCGDESKKWDSLENIEKYYGCEAEVRGHVAGILGRIRRSDEDPYDRIMIDMETIKTKAAQKGYSETEMDPVLQRLYNKWADRLEDLI